MRFTARARLDTWAHASRVQSDEVMSELRMEPAALAAGDSDGAGGDGARRADVAALEHAVREKNLGDKFIEFHCDFESWNDIDAAIDKARMPCAHDWKVAHEGVQPKGEE